MWKPAGLYNGATGKIKEILVDEDGKLQCFLIKFDSFVGNGFQGTDLVPIEPQTVSHQDFGKHFRILLPLDICDAFTIFKAQGKTIQKG